MTADWKLYLQLALAAGIFFAGWKANQYRNDSMELAAMIGAQKVADAERERESRVSKVLEDKLAVLDERQWVVFRDRTKVVEKPVYRNQCLDDDGVQLINAAKGGTAGQYTGGMPAVTRSAGY